MQSPLQTRAIARAYRVRAPILSLLVLLALIAPRSDAANCTDLKDNLLTSECPSSCQFCILYSPSPWHAQCEDKTEQYQTNGHGLVCGTEKNFALPTTGSICDVSYGCLYAGSGNRLWIPTSGVTKVYGSATVGFDYPRTPSAIIWDGDGSGTLTLPDFIFATPDTATRVEFHRYPDLSDDLHSMTSYPTSVVLSGDGLTSVPSSVETLPRLTELDLFNNSLSALPELWSAKTLETLVLDSNDFKTIPRIIFSMPKLKRLDFGEYRLPALSLTRAQFAFLKAIPDLTINPAEVYSCLSNYEIDSLKGSNVCVIASSPRYWIPALVSGGVVGVVIVLVICCCRRCPGCCAGCCGKPKQLQNVSSTTGTRPNTAGTQPGTTGSLASANASIPLATVVAVDGPPQATAALRPTPPLASTQVQNNLESVQPLSRRVQHHIQTTASAPYEELYDAEPATAHLHTQSSQCPHDFDSALLSLRIDSSRIQALDVLAYGAFGEVWRGTFHGRDIAIKRMLPNRRTSADVQVFVAEIKTMARLQHPKIVTFFGASWTTMVDLQAVTEFLPAGDLGTLLHSAAGASLTWPESKLRFAVDVADALVYLHSLEPKVMHRDLKPRNVLLDGTGGVKLSDFGLARARRGDGTATASMTAGIGTTAYIAPELLRGTHYSEAIDIYSFGALLSELDTCKVPYHDAIGEDGARMNDFVILQGVVSGALQPSFSPWCPTAVLLLARGCMSQDPSMRPTAAQAAFELRKLQYDKRVDGM